MSALRDALRDLSEDVFFDLLESEDAYLLVLDVPGVSTDSLDLSIEEGHISIEARREKDPDDDYHYLEENRSLFLDVELPLPTDATDSGSEATVERGVLELRLPKRTEVDETTIDVVDGDV
ncbi:Hsp20/alpha crystallin family protein [Halosolutus halophilus]|uniref:Hsp20/alpha crystallin family protein n=1 Tax=Halosolutus halophilus TaxID=1552990 RepID=UPI002234FFBA|nr:Hsp20/alpha crystallin family protein [Halosolutus halophilus]